ncbi:MAG: LysM peptidoglycan-binding domain-containing protein [Spirochaetaceae bacterium]|nr:MAG: LysM peptidoglycan-binding domain-containing protein [Spirochaetaceae bacterium]
MHDLLQQQTVRRRSCATGSGIFIPRNIEWASIPVNGFVSKVQSTASGLLQKLLSLPVVVYAIGMTTVLAVAFIFSISLQTLPRAAGQENTRNQEEISDEQLLIDSAFADMKRGNSPFPRTEDVSVVIKSGDTLFKLGLMYKIDTDDLRAYNRIEFSSDAAEGVHIVIPSSNNLVAWKSREAARLAYIKAQMQAQTQGAQRSLLEIIPDMENTDVVPQADTETVSVPVPIPIPAG